MMKKRLILTSVTVLLIALIVTGGWLYFTQQSTYPPTLDSTSNKVFPPPPPPPPPPQVSGEEKSLDQLLEAMELGSIAFNAPTAMNINESGQIQLLLSLSEPMEQLQQQLTANGEAMGAVIKVSNRMEARLSGTMFSITSITPEVQAISKALPTEWRWEVSPIKEGSYNLHLTLTALFEIEGRETPRTIKTFEQVISVEVTATQRIKGFINENWRWFWAVLLVPTFGWLVSRIKSFYSKKGANESKKD